MSFIIYTCYIYAIEHESGINMYSYISHFSIEISKSTEARSKVEEDMVEEKKKKELIRKSHADSLALWTFSKALRFNPSRELNPEF